MAAMAAVCNHTYSHPRLTKLSDAGIKAEIAGGTHVNCDLMRPPWGDWDGPGGRVERIANSQGFRIQMWDVETFDWAGASTADILASIRAQGGIVLLHLNGYHTVEALRDL
jgi:peptidoglycan/xylan/chitin deacetylase (PgdA/CDA1 family)